MSWNRQQLPLGWVAATIEDIFASLEDGRTLHQGWSPQCEDAPSGSDGDWGVLKTTAIQAGAFLPEHNKRLPAHLSPRPVIEVHAGDILVTCAGPRVRCGVACLVRNTRPHLMLSGKMYRFRMPDNIDARFMEAYLQTAIARDEIERMKTGGSDSGLNLTHDRFRTLHVILAPLNEQRRIVAKVEELLSDLDAGVAALERAKANLIRYRATILKAAVEGKLTTEWRKKHLDVEPASKLLDRILVERRKKWEEAECTKYATAKKTPPKGWKEKYKEPAGPDTTNVPDLPKGWCWTRAEQVCTFITKGSTPRPEKLFSGSGEVPFLKVYNLTHSGSLDFSMKPTFVDFRTHAGELARSRVVPGDVLMNIVGPPLGKVSIVPNDFPEWNINQAVALYRAIPGLSRNYLSFTLLSKPVVEWAERRAKATAGQFNLTLEICRNLPIPLPPAQEQEQVVKAVQEQLVAIDKAHAQVEEVTQRANRLRQAILKHAFAGKLIPQDPNDEPADRLLERVKVDRKVDQTPRTRAPSRKHTTKDIV